MDILFISPQQTIILHRQLQRIGYIGPPVLTSRDKREESFRENSMLCHNIFPLTLTYITVSTTTFSYKTFLTFIPSPLFFITPFNEGCKVLGALKEVMKNRGLGMNVKKVLYEKVVVPTVMYGSESWDMKVTERQKLNVFEMKCLRSKTGVSRLDRVRNEVVRARTGVRRELAARVDMNVLRWFGHVERMDNERLMKKVMNAKVDGRSARGRPRFGWMDGVKRALNDRRMDIREASERARNRNEWRMIVTQF